MLCKKCKVLHTTEGFHTGELLKNVKCSFCDTYIITKSGFANICKECSDKRCVCKVCGKVEKEVSVKTDVKLRSAADSSRATEQANVRLHNSRMERITETINTAISEGKYSVSIDDLDKESIVKLRELGYTVGKYNQYNEFYCVISW